MLTRIHSWRNTHMPWMRTQATWEALMALIPGNQAEAMRHQLEWSLFKASSTMFVINLEGGWCVCVCV